MSQYYCPFCSSRKQSYKTNSDGVFFCGQCGDPLIKKKYIDTRQIVGIIAAFAFLSPLLLITYFVIDDFTEDKSHNNSESLVMFNIVK